MKILSTTCPCISFEYGKKIDFFLMLQNFPIQLYGSTQPSVIFVLKVQMWSESFLLCLRWGEENGLRNREMCSFIVYSMVLRRSLWLWIILPSVWISMPDCVCVRVNYYTLFPESLIWFRNTVSGKVVLFFSLNTQKKVNASVLSTVRQQVSQNYISLFKIPLVDHFKIHWH